MKKDILYDIEDDVIDRGDSSNIEEAFDALGIEDIAIIEPRESDALGTAEAAYHNSYYKGKGKGYGPRSLRLGESRIITPEEAEAWYQESLNG